MDHDHGDETQGESGIDVGGWTTHDGDEDFFTVEDTVKTDRTSTGQKSGPVTGDNKDKEGHNEGKEHSGFGGAGDTLDDAIETFDEKLNKHLKARKFAFHKKCAGS